MPPFGKTTSETSNFLTSLRISTQKNYSATSLVNNQQKGYF